MICDPAATRRDGVPPTRMNGYELLFVGSFVFEDKYMRKQSRDLFVCALQQHQQEVSTTVRTAANFCVATLLVIKGVHVEFHV